MSWAIVLKVAPIFLGVLGWVISFVLFRLLVSKRNRKIKEHNAKIIKREQVEKEIKEKYKGKEEKLDEDIKKAKTAKDFLDIIGNN